MQFELDIDVAPGPGLVEIFHTLVEHAQECLEIRDADTDSAVHDARKSLKKIRAVLRLLRPALDNKSFKTADHAVRDLGRRLGSARDGAVLLEAFNRLIDYYAPFVDAEGMQPVRENLQSHYHSAMHVFLASIDVRGLEQQLQDIRQRIDASDLGGFSQSMLLASVRRTYGSGRQRLKVLHAEPSTGNSHAFRRQVKYLWNQLQLLCNWNPGVLGPVVAGLDELGELLGQDHDLAMLTGTLQAHPGIARHPVRAELINGLAETRRIALLSTGLRLANRLYAHKPTDFISRFSGAVPT